MDVQADILDALNTRVVVPLMPVIDAPHPAKQLNPVFDIDETSYVMVTQFMAAVPTSFLRTPVTTFAKWDADITNALDMVFFGI